MVTDVLNSTFYVEAVPIYNGEMADERQFPFAVSFGINVKNSSSFKHFCGGSIVENDFKFSWAISAAHCFVNFNQNDTYAIIGSTDLTISNLTNLCSIRKVYVNDYKVYNYQNDIALVKIECQYQQYHHDQQVIEISNVEPTRNLDCLIYGYGSLHSDINAIPSNKLYYGIVEVISLEECESIIGRAIVPMPDTGQFCGRGKEPKHSDACSGDSGSALICKSSKDSQYSLFGIISSGMGCGSHSAGIYESAAYHRLWIESTLQSECLIGEE